MNAHCREPLGSMSIDVRVYYLFSESQCPCESCRRCVHILWMFIFHPKSGKAVAMEMGACNYFYWTFLCLLCFSHNFRPKIRPAEATNMRVHLIWMNVGIFRLPAIVFSIVCRQQKCSGNRTWIFISHTHTCTPESWNLCASVPNCGVLPRE